MARTSFGRGFRQIAASAALLLGALTSFGAALTLDATAAHAALAACTDSWTGTAGDGLWSTASNWLTSSSTEAVPTSSDVVCIGNNSSASPFAVTLTSGVTVAALELGGTTMSTLTLSNVQLSLGTAANDPSEIFSNGVVDLNSAGSGELTNANSSIVTTVDSGGIINTSTAASSTAYLGLQGALTFNAGATLNVSGSGTTLFYSAVNVTNNGTITVNSGTLSGASTKFTNNASIVNNATASLNTDYVNRGSASGANAVTLVAGTYDDDTSAGAGSYNATGGIILTGTGSSPGIASGQTLTLSNVTATTNVTSFTIDGTVDLNSAGSGELLNGASGDAMTVASGGIINTSTATSSTGYLGLQGTLTFNAGAALNVSGPGTTVFYSVVNVTNNGTITVNSGTLSGASTKFTNNASIVNNATASLNTDYVNRGSASGTNPVTLVAGTFDDDTSAGAGSYNATGTITLTGTGSSPGIASGQTLTLSNVTATTNVTSFTIDGTVDLNSAGSGELLNGASGDAMTVASGGIINTSTATSSTGYLGLQGTLTFNAGATLNVSGPGTTVFYSVVNVTNNGTITVNSGTLSGASTKFTNNASIVNNATASLNTDYVNRGSASGTNPVTLVAGTFDDDTSAGAGSYNATGTITLTGTGSSPGIASGQTLTLSNVTATTNVTSFTIDGTVDLNFGRQRRAT